jgi:hypothetical protein
MHLLADQRAGPHIDHGDACPSGSMERAVSTYLQSPTLQPPQPATLVLVGGLKLAYQVDNSSTQFIYKVQEPL